MSTKEETIADVAVKIASSGENVNIQKNLKLKKTKYDKKEFFHFVGIWFVTAIILFSSLVLIKIITGDLKNIIYAMSFS